MLGSTLFGDDTIKSLVFTILTNEHPLKLIDLMNFIRKRYGRSVTFQAVRKATLQLVEEGVLRKDGKEFEIREEWIETASAELLRIRADIADKPSATSHFMQGGDVRVYAFTSLGELTHFWEDIIEHWRTKRKKGDPNINCYQGAHIWEGLQRVDRERQVMGSMKEKGIKSYAVCTGSTPLDRAIAKFYSGIGLKMHVIPSLKRFDKSYYVGTYGDIVVQTQYPPSIVKALDQFFTGNKDLTTLNLHELDRIVNKKIPMKLTVIKDAGMAKQINASILAQVP